MRCRGTVRMGYLNILVLVVAMCLTVLAVLSLSSSQAADSLSERQGDAILQSYAVDSAAQMFLSDVDMQLKAAQDSGSSSGDVMSSLRGLLPAYAEDGAADEVRYRAYGVAFQASLMDVQQLGSAVRADAFSGDLAGGVSATFTSGDGQQLTCLLGITNDAGFRVLSWESEKIWQEGAQSEKLWQGRS